MMRQKRHAAIAWLTGWLLLLPVCAASAQQKLTIDSFEATNDISATQYPRKDGDKICALVKILVIDQVTAVQGSTVDDPAGGRTLVYKGMETWVWLKPGSTSMRVVTANHGTTDVNFETYGISALAGTTTYLLTLLDAGTARGSTGVLKVNYMPINCNVLIDGQVVGKTPGLFRNLPTGSHKLEIKKEGYSPISERILVSSRTTATVNGNLTKTGATQEAIKMTEAMGGQSTSVFITGILGVSYEPADSEVLVDGMRLGYTPDVFQLYAGDYEVEIRHPGYQSEKRQVNIGVGQRFTISGTLKANE